MAEPTPVSRAGLAIGAALLIIGGVVAVDALRMQVPPSYARVGPHIFPFVVAICLGAIGAYFGWNSSSPHARREIASEPVATDWRAVLLVASGLLIHLLLLKTLGFILVSAVLFFIVAVAFGSRHYARDGLIAIVLSALTYLG